MRSAGTDHAGLVLVAEDNRVNQMIARAMLQTLGFEVDIVADGATAVRAAADIPYRAIFMDCQLPVLDGFEATRAIRRAEGERRRTPIIAITASTSLSDRQRGTAVGMDGYLVKPLSLDELVKVLDRPLPDRADAPAVEGSTGAVLDPRVITRLQRLGTSAGEDLMGQLATLFLADADVRRAELHGGLAAHDVPAMNRAAHTLCGAAANLGATDLARCCADLAKHAAADDPGEAAVLVEAIDTELERVRLALGSWRSTAGQSPIGVS
jgi:two-component system sensor histidine kinase/response regulator